MVKKKYNVVMFSKELAEASDDQQTEAVRMLWDFLAKKKGIKPKGKEHKLVEEFGMHFTGRIEEYRQYADAYGILFQPEVFRGFLSPKERRRVKGYGFDTRKVASPK